MTQESLPGNVPPENVRPENVRPENVRPENALPENALPENGPRAGRLRYRVLTGPDDSTFCQRVSQALADGYQLHGGPALTFDGERVIVAQALVLSPSMTGTIQEA